MRSKMIRSSNSFNFLLKAPRNVLWCFTFALTHASRYGFLYWWVRMCSRRFAGEPAARTSGRSPQVPIILTTLLGCEPNLCWLWLWPIRAWEWQDRFRRELITFDFREKNSNLSRHIELSWTRWIWDVGKGFNEWLFILIYNGEQWSVLYHTG